MAVVFIMLVVGLMVVCRARAVGFDAAKGRWRSGATGRERFLWRPLLEPPFWVREGGAASRSTQGRPPPPEASCVFNVTFEGELWFVGEYLENSDSHSAV